MKHEKEETEPGAGALQRAASRERSESKEREQIKDALRKKIRSIREGHGTGGYCDTDALHVEEKKLHAIISTEIEELAAKPDHASAQRKHALERELAAFAWKPKLVVAADQD